MGWRLFVAVDLGDRVRRELERLLPELQRAAPRARWVKPENAHLTLAFLGSREERDVPALAVALEAVARDFAPLALEAAGGGTFGSSRRPRVLWMGIGGELEAFTALHRRVEEALVPLGYQPERREFRPHLTLARAKDPGGEPALARCAGRLEGRSLGQARVDRLILFRSQPGPGGSRYTPLAEPRLSGARC